jgi:hypothetical protein
LLWTQTSRSNRNVSLFIALKETRLRHIRKSGAISSTGAIVLQAELEDSPALAEAFKGLRDFLAPYGMTLDQYFAGSLLVNLIAEVELYFTEVVRHILTAFPHKLGAVQFKFSEIHGQSSDEIVLMAAERHLTSLMFKRPAEYLAELAAVMSISAGEIQPYWPPYIEAKARRDLGIHNNWCANDTYSRKVSEAGLSPRTERGAFICPDHEYIQGAMTSCENLVAKVSSLVEAKFEPH